MSKKSLPLLLLLLSSLCSCGQFGRFLEGELYDMKFYRFDSGLDKVGVEKADQPKMTLEQKMKLKAQRPVEIPQPPASIPETPKK